MNKKRLAVFTGLLMFLNISIFAQFISVKKDANGWRLLDDRKEIEVKGIVWSYTPIGETHTYDLWSKSDEFIERMIDTDMQCQCLPRIVRHYRRTGFYSYIHQS